MKCFLFGGLNTALPPVSIILVNKNGFTKRLPIARIPGVAGAISYRFIVVRRAESSAVYGNVRFPGVRRPRRQGQ